MTEVSNRSVGRALEIIKLLSSHEFPLGLKDIAEGLGLPRSSTLTLLRALRDYDFVAVDDDARLADLDLALVLGGQAVDGGGQATAWPTPGGPKINQNGH